MSRSVVSITIQHPSANWPVIQTTIAWLLFFLFWTVSTLHLYSDDGVDPGLVRMRRQIGSGIFCATEGWSYGTAMYFCRYLSSLMLARHS